MVNNPARSSSGKALGESTSSAAWPIEPATNTYGQRTVSPDSTSVPSPYKGSVAGDV